MKKFILTVLTFIMLTSTSFAEDPGTREEAAALLDRAIAILSIDKNRALEQLTSGDGGMIQGDLYVFCFISNWTKLSGTITAHPAAIGFDIFSDSDLKDENGIQLGESMTSNAKLGVISEVVYQLRKYDTDSEEEYTKTTLYTKVADQICGVGFYN